MNSEKEEDNKGKTPKAVPYLVQIGMTLLLAVVICTWVRNGKDLPAGVATMAVVVSLVIVAGLSYVLRKVFPKKDA